MKVLILSEHPVLRCGYLMARRYLRHRVAIQSAALAFYFLFTLFPFLIFISALLGSLRLDVAAILAVLDDILPREIVDFAELYLNHVSRNSSLRLLAFGLVFSVYFPMRATNTLMRAVRTAYHLGPPRSVVRHWMKTLVYTVLLMAAIAVTLTLLTVSDRALLYAVKNFRLPLLAAELWGRLRFPLIGAMGFFALFALYAAAQDARQPWRNIWPGSLAALAGWMMISWLYAWYVENVAHYPALYGSIGTVIVLMIWLNMSAVALILGAELNGTIISLRKDAAQQFL